MGEEPVFTVEGVAAYLQCQPDTVRHMIRRGELRAFKVGHTWRIRSEDLLAFITPRSPQPRPRHGNGGDHA